MDAAGDWKHDNALRSEMLKGRAVHGPIWWGRTAVGIAFGGDAADWLAFRLESPIFRETLMDPLADQIGLAVHGDPAVGFGAAAVTYSLFTPQREQLFADDIAQRIAESRCKLPTHRVANPPEFEKVARGIAAGEPPEHAFAPVLTRLNLASRGLQYLDGVFLNLPAASISTSRHRSATPPTSFTASSRPIIITPTTIGPASSHSSGSPPLVPQKKKQGSPNQLSDQVIGPLLAIDAMVEAAACRRARHAP